MLARLAAAFEAQRRFVANASHELRTPLTAQRAAVDVALADPHPTVDSLRTMAKRIRRGTQQHEHLIASLLTLAHSERGIERYQVVDLGDVLRGILVAETKDLQLTCELRAAPVRGDPVLLERLAANLIDNAVRHNTPGGWIHVRTWLDGEVGSGGVINTAVLHVANSGPVIPAEVGQTLFEPFRRMARTADNQGHGLGLSIVAAITVAHHGTCRAWPRPDGGLDITVTLPAQPAQLTLAAAQSAWSSPLPSPPSVTRSRSTCAPLTSTSTSADPPEPRSTGLA
jgi:signal transduction histidine kinase